MSTTNPISPGLHPIPSKCPICNTDLMRDARAYSEDAPYGDDGGIEDLCLNLDHDPDDPNWTVCHVSCKYWFRDEAVNLLPLMFIDTDCDDGTYTEEDYNQLHEAIRNSIGSYAGLDVLIAMLGTNYFEENN